MLDSKNKTFLIVLLGAVGDAILASIVLENIKQAYPNCQIHWLILQSYYDTVANNISNIDKWIIVESILPQYIGSKGFDYYYKEKQILQDFLKVNNTEYDVIIKLIGEDRDEILDIKQSYDGNQAKCFLEACNLQLPIKTDSYSNSYNLTDEDKKLWDNWASNNIDTNQKYVCSEMFARSAAKAINNEQMISLAQKLYKEDKIKTIFMYAKSDIQKTKEFYNKLTLGGNNPYIMCDLPLGAATYGVKQIGKLFISYCTGQSWAVCATNKDIPIVEILSKELIKVHPEIGNKYNPFGAKNIESLVMDDVNLIYKTIKKKLK